MPLPSSRKPKLKRAAPLLGSIPTVPRIMPRTSVAKAFRSEPRASTTTPTRPRRISEKYSAGPTYSAMRASLGAKAATKSVAMVPAAKEPIAAMASAGPARPFRAIWWPSTQVMTDEASPGRLIRIAVVDPRIASRSRCPPA